MARDYIKVTSQIKGMDDLIVEMGKLSLNVLGTTRKAVRVGARVIRDQAEANAKQVGSGKGKHVRIKISTRTGKDQYDPAGHFIRAGTGKSGVSANIGPTAKKWYYRFLELGTSAKERIAGTKGPFVFEGRDGKMVVTRRIHHPGMAARPWLRPAFDSKTNDATAAMGTEFGRCIDERKAQLDEGADEE